jgi:hypothetical protein
LVMAETKICYVDVLMGIRSRGVVLADCMTERM